MIFGPPSPLMSMMLMGCGSSGGGSVTAPSAPTGVIATHGDRTVLLQWDAAVGATSYKMFRSTTNSFGTATEVAESPVVGTNETIVFTDLQAGELYYFWVVATNGAGDSDPSTSASARPYVTLADAAVANLTTPTGSWTLTTLFFSTGGNLPFGCNLTWNAGSNIAVSLGDGTWENQFTFEAPYDAAISGAFEFTNGSGASVTFWNTEP